MDAGIKLKQENPKKNANILSKLFFFWMIKLYQKATNYGLEIPDLYKTLSCDNSQTLGDTLEQNWSKELTKSKMKNRKPKLIKTIFTTFIGSYMVWGAVLFIQHVGLRTFQPIVLSYLIALFSNDAQNFQAMYILSSLLVGITLLIVFTMHHANFGQAAIGMRIRIAISSLIYRKSLKLNRKSLSQTAIGQVVNLLSNDVSRFDLVILTLHYLWIMPFQVALITYLLWFQVGYASLVGVASIALLSLPVQGYLGKLTSTYRLKVAQKTDYRVTLMSEIISGIQVIKMYAWERPFERIVQLARLEEIHYLTIMSYLRAIYLSSMVFVERVALFLSIVTYVCLGNELLAEYVFSMAQFFNLLQLTMSIFYPMSISLGAEALVSVQRIEEFLLMDENRESVVERDFGVGVELCKVQASWTSQSEVLKTITCRVEAGELCAIIGPVGAGKSSLLQLLLGELHPDFGSVRLQGSVSYCSQEPWLFASTIRNNILFGETYSRKAYNKVVKVCALQKDFDQLPNGDKTLVGERGSALSGGQRARVNLARAVYRNADVYLFDDPLSAVDTKVGKHLFEECIVKYLRGKTRILVTHQLQYLKKADQVIVLNDGRIDAQGSYAKVRSSGMSFTNEFTESLDEGDKEKSFSLLTSTSCTLESIDQQSELAEEEEVLEGTPLKDYIKANGSTCQIVFVVCLLLFGQALCSGADYWVTFWTQQEYIRQKVSSADDLVSRPTAIYVYTVLIISAICFTLFRSLFYFKMAMNSSTNLHDQMFQSLLEAPMRFFNLNPTGRILNRFSKDMGAIDEILPKVLLEALQITLVMSGILVMVVISNYFMIVAVVILGYVFMMIRRWFIITAKDIKHIEGITKSPVFSHFNSTLLGMATIRAFSASKMLQQEFDHHQDVHTSAWFLTIMCMVSFGLWLDLICAAFIACTTFSFIILNYYGQVNGSLVGLAISQSLILTGMLQYGIRQTAEVVNQLTCVERVRQYSGLDKEGPFRTPSEQAPQQPWPSRGRVEICDLFLQYNPHDMPVLKNLNIRFKPGQKIGIVGRTGAGKSSLITALFRLTEIQGTVIIDGVDTNKIGLWDLRKNISIIPQEPVLFSATLRYNLDPFGEFDDEMIWRVLEAVELRDSVDHLEILVVGGGANFSVGQRQLLCLARAILRNNKILVLDEATANIDHKTDALIQKTIRRKFNKCTVLTVAHRLNTIMDSDRVIVMEHGEIVEFDHPYRLLQRPDTMFYKMVLETGLSMGQHLEEIALEAFLNRRTHQEE